MIGAGEDCDFDSVCRQHCVIGECWWCGARFVEMPAVLPMRSVAGASKARTSGSARGLARARAEQGREDGAAGAMVVMKGNGSTMGLLSSQLRACGAMANGAKVAESDSEKIRSKLFGNGVDLENRFGHRYISSGSEHELNSVCLGAMVDRFMEDEADCGRSRCSCKLSESVCECNDFDDYKPAFGGELSEILQDLVLSANVTERMLLAEVNKAIAVANDVVSGRWRDRLLETPSDEAPENRRVQCRDLQVAVGARGELPWRRLRVHRRGVRRDDGEEQACHHRH